jgi:hypothetical protein
MQAQAGQVKTRVRTRAAAATIILLPRSKQHATAASAIETAPAWVAVACRAPGSIATNRLSAIGMATFGRYAELCITANSGHNLLVELGAEAWTRLQSPRIVAILCAAMQGRPRP